MILLWGLPGDRPLAAVHQALRRLGAAVLLLDQRDVLHTEVELCVGATVRGTLWIKGQEVDLSSVSAVYLRPYDCRELPAIASAGPESQVWRHALEVEDLLTSWIELTPALVVNPPAAMATNNSKPYQANWIRSFGLDIPETLITTDPDAALDFWQRYDQVIYKSVSGIRSIVSRLGTQHVERLARVEYCPTQFQRYIPGRDYRVHVVADEVFACQIMSEADDYRYSTRSGASVSIQPCELPEEIANRCKALAASMNLMVAGVDLRCTPEGKWYCFEVNPSPGFTYFQEETNQPIDEAIARLLASRESKA
jgi:hypothetical protein